MTLARARLSRLAHIIGIFVLISVEINGRTSATAQATPLFASFLDAAACPSDRPFRLGLFERASGVATPALQSMSPCGDCSWLRQLAEANTYASLHFLGREASQAGGRGGGGGRQGVSVAARGRQALAASQTRVRRGYPRVAPEHLAIFKSVLLQVAGAVVAGTAAESVSQEACGPWLRARAGQPWEATMAALDDALRVGGCAAAPAPSSSGMEEGAAWGAVLAAVGGCSQDSDCALTPVETQCFG